ncbi:MAG TPA: tetratricopeptide repeat protein [Candidatus Nanoarchaeia archaeon]|nr:tetratricopeptide repeat protein [Candidatus Nanoarchaeia archaeon]
MTQRTDEKQARVLLDSAVATRSIDIERAMGLFAALKDTKFEYQDVAWQQYAICLHRTGQYKEAETELKRLVKEYGEASIFRAKNLRHLAQVVAAQGRIGEIGKWVDEAIRIYEANRDFYNLGRMFQIKALDEAKTVSIAKALERLQDGQRMVEDYTSQTKSETTSRTTQQPLLAGV